MEQFVWTEETLLEFRAGKMNFEGKRVVPDTHKGFVRITRGEEGLIHFQWLDRTKNAILMWFSIRTFRAGNLVVPNLSAEVISDITSSCGPVKLEDLQRILSNIGPADISGDPDGGLGLGDTLKPELIMPLIDSLPLEQRLAPFLPEVLKTGQINLSQFGVDPSKYKFTVLSFLEALEESVSKMSESEESRQDDKDLMSQSCNRNDPMDEPK